MQVLRRERKIWWNNINSLLTYSIFFLHVIWKRTYFLFRPNKEWFYLYILDVQIHILNPAFLAYRLRLWSIVLGWLTLHGRPYAVGGQFGQYKKMEIDWNHGTWILIWESWARAIPWILTWHGSDVFWKSLHPCSLTETSLSYGRVKCKKVKGHTLNHRVGQPITLDHNLFLL